MKSIVERDSRYVVAGEAGTGRQGLRMAKQLKPDLAVVDISLPDINGIQIASEMKSVLPDTKIMIVSMHSKIDYIAEGFQSGATWLCGKRFCLRQAYSGDRGGFKRRIFIWIVQFRIRSWKS